MDKEAIKLLWEGKNQNGFRMRKLCYPEGDCSQIHLRSSREILKLKNGKTPEIPSGKRALLLRKLEHNCDGTGARAVGEIERLHEPLK